MTKKKYSVYYVGKGTGCYAENYKRIYLRDVWAKSKAQACSMVRYSLRDKKYPNGGYSTDFLGDSEDMGFVEFYYEAVEIN